MTHNQHIAKFDFVGDARMRQLSFPQNSVIEISQGQRPKNGWLWGTCYGEEGWFPAWAIGYDETHKKVNESQGLIGPSAILSTIKTDDCNGFDTRVNNIMGGEIPKQKVESNGIESNPSSGPKSADVAEPSAKSRNFLGRFRKLKINPVHYEKAKPPEWTAEPQIIYEGKVIQEFSQKKRGLFQR